MDDASAMPGVVVAVLVPRLERVIICAFCFRTSAGVRIRQETSSAVLEARVWDSGVGREVLERRVLAVS